MKIFCCEVVVVVESRSNRQQTNFQNIKTVVFSAHWDVKLREKIRFVCEIILLNKENLARI